MFKPKRATQAQTERSDHVPGKMEQMEYNEVSPCDYPANGRLFLVRRGFELSADQKAQLAKDGLTPPATIEDFARGIAEAVGEKVASIWRSLNPESKNPEGAQDMPQETNPETTTETQSQTVEQIARSIATDVFTAQFAEIKEAQRSLDERLTAIEQEAAAVKTTQTEQSETLQEVQRSIENFRPAGSSPEDREPTAPASQEQVNRHQSVQEWAEILNLKA